MEKDDLLSVSMLEVTEEKETTTSPSPDHYTKTATTGTPRIYGVTGW